MLMLENSNTLGRCPPDYMSLVLEFLVWLYLATAPLYSASNISPLYSSLTFCLLTVKRCTGKWKGVQEIVSLSGSRAWEGNCRGHAYAYLICQSLYLLSCSSRDRCYLGPPWAGHQVWLKTSSVGISKSHAKLNHQILQTENPIWPY